MCTKHLPQQNARAVPSLFREYGEDGVLVLLRHTARLLASTTLFSLLISASCAATPIRPHPMTRRVTRHVYGATVTIGSSLARELPKGETALHVTGPNEAWLAGIDPMLCCSSILRSQNGGRSWRRIMTISNGQVRAMSWVGFQDGWLAVASGAHVWLETTSNAGKTWRAYNTKGLYESSGTLNAMTFMTTRFAWALWNGNLVASDDGGMTWHALAVGERNKIIGAKFTSTRSAWSITEPREGGPGISISLTTDGGRTWTTRFRSETLSAVGPIAAKGNVVMAAVDDIAHRDTSMAVVSTDRGTHWRVVALPDSVPPGGITALIPTVRSSGWALVGPCQIRPCATGLVHYSNFGQTWKTYVLPSAPPSAVQSIAVASKLLWADMLMPTNANCIYVSFDQGITWTKRSC